MPIFALTVPVSEASMATDRQLHPDEDPRDRRIADLEAMASKLSRQVEALQKQNAKLVDENDRLRKENAELRRRLGQDSTNSHRPPSSDSPRSKRKRKKKKKASPNKPGKQPGAPGHHRQRLEPDKIVDLAPEACEHCGEGLAGVSHEPHVHQVVDLPPIEPVVIDYRLHQLTCQSCGHKTKARLPSDVPTTTYGARISALAATLSGRFRLSRRLVKEFFKTVCRLDISLGTLSNHEGRVTEALESAHQEAKAALDQKPSLFVDETGWPIQNGEQGWLWTAGSGPLVVFGVHSRRSSKALGELVGDFGGVIHSDRHRSYSVRDVELRQYCWAHLDRNFKDLACRDGPVGAFGEAMEAISSLVMTLWRWQKTGFVEFTDDQLVQVAQKLLKPRLHQLCKAGVELDDAPGIFQRLIDEQAALWTFVQNPDVEQTNNFAERSLRRGVIWRKVSFGSRAERGERFVERMLTVGETLSRLGKSVVDFVHDSLIAHRTGLAAPSLLGSS